MKAVATALFALALGATSAHANITGNPDDWSLTEDWSDYTTGVCESDGGIFGAWQSDFAGVGGCTQVTASNHLELGGTVNAALVHTPMVQGDPSVGADIYLDIKLKTLAQYAGSPQPYQVGWVTWNGRLDPGCSCYTFNYFLVKPTVGGVTGGYELGVVYNNGGVQGQRFLATGTGNYAINTTYDITIYQANATENGPGNVVTAEVNGTTLVNGFVDSNHYMFSDGWAVGLYEEAAKVDFISVSATRL